MGRAARLVFTGTGIHHGGGVFVASSGFGNGRTAGRIGFTAQVDGLDQADSIQEEIPLYRVVASILSGYP